MAHGNGTEKLTPRGVPGIEIQLGRVKYILAPIKIGKMRELEPEFDKLYALEDGEAGVFKIKGIERSLIMAKFILESLRRNYDSIITDEGSLVPLTVESVVEELIDLGNREDAFSAAMGVSGLVPSSGEALAVEQTGTTTGSLDSSTASPLLMEPTSPAN